MNLDVHALSEDRRVSRGLCGNYDGDPQNDLTQDGLAGPTYLEEPIAFSTYFM